MTDPHALERLTSAETQQLQTLEARIRVGWTSFIDVGEALLEIRDARLYRATDATFDAYCDRAWGWSRHRAYQLIGAAQTAQTMSTIGLHPENERQAREFKKAAEVVSSLPAEDIPLLAQAIRNVTGSNKPSTSEVRAVADTLRDLHNTTLIENPDTGEQVPWTELPERARAAFFHENVTTNAYERLQRQRNHIEDSKAAASKPNVIDWLDDYGSNNLTPDQKIVITRTHHGYTAKLNDETTGEVLAEAEGSYFKKALLGLIEQLGTTKGEDA